MPAKTHVGSSTTPASIQYLSEGDAINSITFHAVISEGHKASTQVTKFPVQSGFQVSSHAIRQNRIVALEGVISDIVMKGSRNSVMYSDISNSVRVFDVLNQLLRDRIACKVVTNLGVYDPVIFTSFGTKQDKNNISVMHFSLSGEELQTFESNNDDGTVRETMFEEIEEGSEEKSVIGSLMDACGFRKAIPADGDLDSVYVSKEKENQLVDNPSGDHLGQVWSAQTVPGSSLIKGMINAVGQATDILIESFSKVEEVPIIELKRGVGYAADRARSGVSEVAAKSKLRLKPEPEVPFDDAGPPGLFDSGFGKGVGDFVSQAASIGGACLMDGAQDIISKDINSRIDDEISNAYGKVEGQVREAVGGSSMFGNMATECVMGGLEKGAITEPTDSEGYIIDSSGDRVSGVAGTPIKTRGMPSGQDMLNGVGRRGGKVAAGATNSAIKRFVPNKATTYVKAAVL